MTDWEDLKVDWWFEARRPKTMREKFLERVAKIIFPFAWYLDQRKRKKVGQR
jgi:hypothetical protein